MPIDFTHVGILRLAQRGDLSLSDPITYFFDDVALGDGGGVWFRIPDGEADLLLFARLRVVTIAPELRRNSSSAAAYLASRSMARFAYSMAVSYCSMPR